jgi:ATPase subunit of ABC transporter with duplicated ATPase domains
MDLYFALNNLIFVLRIGKVVVTGSGEFHTYRQIRRKEMERIKSMDEEAVRHAEQLEFQRKRELIRQEEEERTAKNRAKRHKKKQKTVSKGAKREEQEVGQKEATTDMTVKDAGEEEAANNVHNGGVKSSPVNKLIAPLPVQLQPQYPDQLNTGRVFEQPLSAIKSTNLKIIDEEEDIL